MNFQVPPLRPEGSKSKDGGGSWLEEYLEGKDEMLLYITASLGVIMPGLVYILYHKCHAYYERYAQKKEEERLAEEISESEAVVIVLGKDDGPAAAWAKIIHEKLCEEMVQKPTMWMADTLKTKEFANFKGFCIFLVDTLAGGQATPSTEWLLEWLEDLAADSKLKKRANFEKIRFAVVGFGSGEDGGSGFNKVSRILLKRLKIVGSKQMMEVEIYDTLEKGEKIAERFEQFTVELLDAMDRHLPGVERLSDSSEDEMTEISGEEDESDEEEVDHLKAK